VLTLQPKSAQSPTRAWCRWPATASPPCSSTSSKNPSSNRRGCGWRRRPKAACGLFLQKLPNADILDPDGWDRIEALAATVRPEELLLAPETLLTRLFHEESVRLYPPRQASWHCPRDEEKVRNMLLSLGREEVESMLADAEIIAVEDEICGHEYRFDAGILDELFPPDGRTLH
jgi:molecular chaperone Hsp33